MVTQEEEHLENTANSQIKAMRVVLDELKAKAFVHEYPHEFYWFRSTNYAQVDRYGDLECWERGYGNDPDCRSGYALEVDNQLLQDGNIEAFKERFRKKVLPAFNEMRKLHLQYALAASAEAQRKIQNLTGDIE